MFTNHISKISVLLLVFAMAFATVSFAAHPAGVLSADRSYDSLEQARASRPIAHIFSASYDQIETMRVLRNSPNANASYDALEQIRNARGLSADRSYDGIEQSRANRSIASGYDQIEALRLQWKMLPLTTASGYDLIEQLRAGRGTQADRSYDPIEMLRLEP